MSWKTVLGSIALDALKGWWARRQAKKADKPEPPGEKNG